MNYTIENAHTTDLPFIYHLFDEAILFQRRNAYRGWDGYDKAFLSEDVKKGLLYKVIYQQQIACIFSVCYTDQLIWREMDRGNAIYLHRVVLNQQFKGQHLFQQVLDWARQTAIERGLTYIRMDTWADNEKIIDYYKRYGFQFIEQYTTADTTALPLQHRNLTVALLELDVVPDKVNVPEAFSRIDKPWSQQVIGKANGQLIKLAKGEGEINWHKHDDQDELFLLFKGHLTIQLQGKAVELYPNELFIVPRGMLHCPVSHGESEFMIMGLHITSTIAGGRPAHLN